MHVMLFDNTPAVSHLSGIMFTSSVSAQAKGDHGLSLAGLLACLAKFWTYGAAPTAGCGAAWPCSSAPAQRFPADSRDLSLNSTVDLDNGQAGSAAPTHPPQPGPAREGLSNGAWAAPGPNPEGARTYLPPHLRRRSASPAASPQHSRGPGMRDKRSSNPNANRWSSDSEASDGDAGGPGAGGRGAAVRARLAALSCLQAILRTPHVCRIDLHFCLHDEHPAKRTRSLLKLTCVQVLARVDCKALHAHWVTLLPVATPLAGRAQSATLMDAAARDPSHQARIAHTLPFSTCCMGLCC